MVCVTLLDISTFFSFSGFAPQIEIVILFPAVFAEIFIGPFVLFLNLKSMEP